MMDAASLRHDLEVQGFHRLPALLDPSRCAELIKLYEDQHRFRKKVIMARHGYGSGEYQYFDYPLPRPVKSLRTRLYPALARVANEWGKQLGTKSDFPEKHSDYIESCAAAGQVKPTPLILKYTSGDFNRLHQDVYGEHLFPLQLTILLSRPGKEFTGGEFILTEQRPRMQSRARVVSLKQGDAVIFPVRFRPGKGVRGFHRLNMRHGVSDLHSGHRFALGIIFHDAA